MIIAVLYNMDQIIAKNKGITSFQSVNSINFWKQALLDFIRGFAVMNKLFKWIYKRLHDLNLRHTTTCKHTSQSAHVRGPRLTFRCSSVKSLIITMPKITLYYFDFPFWRAEVSRLALHLGNVSLYEIVLDTATHLP